MRILRASDFGITRSALVYWNLTRPSLGQITQVSFGFEPIAEGDVTTIISGEKAEMHLSGTNCGYGGEGPHGSFQILMEIGVPKDLAELVFRQRRLTFTRTFDGTWKVE